MLFNSRTFVKIGALAAGLWTASSSICASALPSTGAELYRLTNVWSIQLEFDASQWSAMEPKGGGGFGGFGRPGRGGPGGPFGGPGFRGPGGPGGPGGPPQPSMFLTPLFLREGDQNSDGKVSREEFGAMGGKWFAAWDKEKRGKIGMDDLTAGLNATLMPPGFGGPGPGPGRPGGLQMGLQGPEGKRNGLASRMGVEFEYVHANLKFESAALNNIAARYKGNGTFLESRGSRKRSIKLDLNKYVKGQKVAGLATLNLHNSVTDASYMNEALAYRLYRDAGVPAPRTAYARVHVTAGDEIKNEYFGLYVMVENVDDDFTRERFSTKGGALFKPVTPALFSDLGDEWDGYKQTYDPKGEPSKEEIARVMEICRFVTKSSDADFAAKLGDYIDLDEFARYMAVTVFLSDLDGILGPGQNFYLFLHPKDKKLRFIPWDQDHSFGQMRGSQEDRERLSVERPWQGENRFLERVFKVEAFQKLYRERLKEFSETLFKAERFNAQVDELAAAIRAAAKDESPERFASFTTAAAGKQPEFGGFGMRAGAKPIKGFAPPRAESIREQLAGKSSGNTVGFGFGPGGGGGRRPGGFGPGGFLAGAFMNALDQNNDKEITTEESRQAFAKLFESWNSDKSGALNEDQLRAGIDKDFAPRGLPPP